MFSTPRPNLYESSEGFSVEVLGRTGLRYREGEREMFVDSEVLTGLSGILIYGDSIEKWDPPNQNEPVTDAERNRILENIRKTFRFQGFEIDVL